MRVVVQKVKHASCTVDGKVTGSIQEGFLLLVGFHESDTEDILKRMIHKIQNLRIFVDENDKMNLSLAQVHGRYMPIARKEIVQVLPTPQNQIFLNHYMIVSML